MRSAGFIPLARAIQAMTKSTERASATTKFFWSMSQTHPPTAGQLPTLYVRLKCFFGGSRARLDLLAMFNEHPRRDHFVVGEAVQQIHGGDAD